MRYLIILGYCLIAIGLLTGCFDLEKKVAGEHLRKGKLDGIYLGSRLIPTGGRRGRILGVKGENGFFFQGAYRSRIKDFQIKDKGSVQFGVFYSGEDLVFNGRISSGSIIGYLSPSYDDNGFGIKPRSDEVLWKRNANSEEKITSFGKEKEMQYTKVESGGGIAARYSDVYINEMSGDPNGIDITIINEANSEKIVGLYTDYSMGISSYVIEGEIKGDKFSFALVDYSAENTELPRKYHGTIKKNQISLGIVGGESVILKKRCELDDFFDDNVYKRKCEN